MTTWTVTLAVLLAAPACAVNWITLQPATAAGLPLLSIDTDSLENRGAGLRRARWKSESPAGPARLSEGRNRISFVIWIETFDCEKQLSHREGDEFHMAHGEVFSHDTSRQATWRPVAGGEAARALAYACVWQPP